MSWLLTNFFRDKYTEKKIFYSLHNSVSLFHYVQHNNHHHHELTKGILQGTKNHTLKYNLDHRLSFPERYHCLIRRELKFEYNVLESYSINCVVYFTFFHNSLYYTVQKKNKIMKNKFCRQRSPNSDHMLIQRATQTE